MLTFGSPSPDAVPVFLLSKEGFETWRAAQSEDVQAWLEATGFKAAAGETCLIPGDNGSVAMALGGLGGSQDRARQRLLAGKVAAALPKGVYTIASEHDETELAEHALAWLLSGYRFDRYKDRGAAKPQLICPEGLDRNEIETIVAGEALTRTLINTPASDMGPSALQQAVEELAAQHGAQVDMVIGDDLLSQNFPMIHTVGRAAADPPRLIDLSWGETGPSLVLVGKGVCFDTGGLNIKPGASMGLMKKDMGGAATVLGLAHMIMGLNLPLRLRVLIPAVENSIDGSAFRPQDILTSRKGLTVEINNTDAEGRLVLADALALADETPPDLMICMATLTGAARVAVGPDLAPFYTDDDGFADALFRGARNVHDPVWRMPFHDPYETMIEPGIADLDNAPKGGFGGSITAALFLRRFVEATPLFAHFDIYGWNPKAAPARPVGGVGQGARAILAALPELLEL